MGIREMAAAAKAADEAHEKAEQKRRWALNAARAEQTVLDLLGVAGKTIRTNLYEEKDHGDGAVVKLEDDLYVKVRVENVYGSSLYGPAPITGRKVYLTLCDEAGLVNMYPIPEVLSLADLHDALTEQDKREAEKAARAARVEAGVRTSIGAHRAST